MFWYCTTTSPITKEDEVETREILAKAGCIYKGNYFFAHTTRGDVSQEYINIDPIFTDAAALKTLGYRLMRPFEFEFNCVVGPAVGGIPFVYAVAFCAIEGLDPTQEAHRVTTAFAEKDGDGFAFGRMNFKKAVQGKRVLVVEDISTTGNTTKAICELVRHAGGELIGASLIWNRGEITAEMLGVPRLHALVAERMETYLIDEDPPGWGTLPLVADMGHPDYYPDYPGPRISLRTT